MKNITNFPAPALFHLGDEYGYPESTVPVEVLARCYDESDYCIRIPVGYTRSVKGIPGSWAEADGRVIVTGVSSDFLTAG